MEQRVAITGIGAVSPLGNTALATWAAMCAGTCGIGPITHFDTDAFAVKVAAEVKGFDGNDYFGKHDAKHLDPCVQFALAASDEAMHDAGFDVEGAIDRERLGVYVGSGVGGMQTLVDNVHTIADRGPRRASPYMIAMMIPNMASGNIAIRHKAKGPTLPVVTACATSAHAVGEAFRAIKHGYADAILAGGAEAAIIPDAVAGFTSCRALTTNPDPATACRPFDANRDGFVMGEAPACSCSRAWNMRRRAVCTFMLRSWATATPMMPITSRAPIPRLPALPVRYRWRWPRATLSLPRASTSTLTAPRLNSTIRPRRRALSVRSARTRHAPRTSRRPSR